MTDMLLDSDLESGRQRKGSETMGPLLTSRALELDAGLRYLKQHAHTHNLE